MVDGGAADDGEDVVAGGDGVGEAFEHDDAAPLAPYDAVRRGVERLAAPVAGHGADLAQEDAEFRGEDQVDAAREGDVGLAGAQALAGEVDGDQRRGAGGVDGHAGALEPEHVGEAAGAEAELASAGVPGADAGQPGLPGVQQGVVHADDAGEDGGPGAGEGGGRLAGVLQCLPGDLQQQPLLGVHLVGLAGRDAEERRVEPVDAVEEGAPPAVHGPAPARVGVEVAVHVPALRWYFLDGVGLRAQEPPEPREPVGPAGEPAARSHHGDRFVHRRVPLQLLRPGRMDGRTVRTGARRWARAVSPGACATGGRGSPRPGG